MYSQIPLTALRSFEAVARLGSFVAAAEELHVTPSAVSHQLRSLEAWMGADVLERAGQGVRLLPRGERLADALSLAFHDIAIACHRARAARDERQLLVAAIPSIATGWLVPNLAGFRARHPKVATRITYALHGQPVDFAAVDLAIVWFREPPRLAGASITRLLAGDSAPVCSPAFLAAHGPLSSPESIAATDLLHDTDMSGWSQWFSLLEGRQVLPPDGPVFEDFNLLRAATLAGQGVSLCPLAIVHDDLAQGRLLQLSSTTVLGESGYYILQAEQAGHLANPAIAAFLDWLMELRDSQAAARQGLAIQGRVW